MEVTAGMAYDGSTLQGPRLGGMTQAWSTDVPGLSMIQAVNRQSTGLASVTVHGAGMGKMAYTGQAREGHTGCEATEWVSDTSVRCKVGQGAQGSRQAVVTAGEQSGSVTQAWSIDVPGLSVMEGVNRQAAGLTWMTVHGASMGNMAYTVQAREGHTGCEATEWVSDTSVRCKVGQGAQGSRRVVVTAGERSGSVTQAWSTDVPGLSVMEDVNGQATGLAWVTVHGASMGKMAYTGQAREGHTGCEATEWVSDTSLRFLVGQGAQGSRRAVVTAGELGVSRSQVWSVDVSAISIAQRDRKSVV